jgi:NTE family protein
MEYGLGIVLSGGGARGVAHAGVLQALGEHGIEPDCIAGSSAGALVGALYAAGYGGEAMLEFFVKNSPFRLSRLAVRKPGWIDTAKVAVDFTSYFPEDDFRALRRKLYVSATDIVHGEATIFDSGPLVPAIIASCSVPLIFTPTTIDGRWYSDGGITNNFPVEPLLGQCKAILGVYASPIRQVHQSHLGTALALSQRALEVGMFSASKAKFGRCGFVVCPEGLNRYGLFDTKHIREIFDIGYEAALASIESIRRVVQDPS